MGKMERICYTPIGIVHSPFRETKGTPIQPAGAKGVEGTVEVFPEFAEGLTDLEGFSHIYLIYHFHLSKGSPLIVRPYMEDREHGVFATRSPSRPNPIGMSVVRLDGIEGRILRVIELDIIDGTPLIDIKPCVPQFDYRKVERIGWLEKNVHRLPETRDDGRFAGEGKQSP